MSEQLQLDFTTPPEAARESACVVAMGWKRTAAHKALVRVFSAAGREGLTPDEACCRAGLDWRYGRPRVTELLKAGDLIAPTYIPRRRFRWPDGSTVRPAAVLFHVRYYFDAIRGLLGLSEAERLTKQQKG